MGVHLEDAIEGGDCVSRGGEDDEVLDAGHDVGDGDVGNGHFGAVIEEGVFVEVNPGLVDATAGEGVADPFGDHDGDHDGQDVSEGAGELKHDDDDGDGHASDTCEGRCCSDNGIGSGRDTWRVRSTGSEEEEAASVVHPNLHQYAHGTTDQGADCHGRQDDAGGDLEAKSDGRKKEADEGGENEEDNGAG